MDPNPKSFPILSYVMSRLPNMASFKVAQIPHDHDDIEQPTPPDHSRGQRDDEVELMERLPLLQRPTLLSSMAASIADVAQTRSVLRALGDYPDHESVDNARVRVAEIDKDLARQIEEIKVAPCPEEADLLQWRAEQEECRARAEREKVALSPADSLQISPYRLTLSRRSSSSSVFGATTDTGASAKVIDGKLVSKQVKDEVAEEIARMKAATSHVPGLAVILVGSRVGLTMTSLFCGSFFLFLVLLTGANAGGEKKASTGSKPWMDTTSGLSCTAFPAGFTFGIAASAYQVERMAHKDGCGPSIWDAFVKIPGQIANNATGDVTVDKYHRYKEDVDIMKKMNFDAY